MTFTDLFYGFTMLYSSNFINTSCISLEQIHFLFFLLSLLFPFFHSLSVRNQCRLVFVSYFNPNPEVTQFLLIHLLFIIF